MKVTHESNERIIVEGSLNEWAELIGFPDYDTEEQLMKHLRKFAHQATPSA